LTLYNSGARVSEVTSLKREQVCFGASTFLQLVGKGRKERTVPLWADTAQTLKAWFEDLGDDAWPIAFPNVGSNRTKVRKVSRSKSLFSTSG
jgi:site-specific recombinase XerD